jgi:CheY-like chemotaxis protein
VAPARQLRQDPNVACIVVIEDHQDTADLMCEILASAGHRVEKAYTGMEGIALARRVAPQLVFCDVGLPDIDGYAVARALRADPATKRAHLIALTGFNGDDERERAIAAGFDQHVVKPLDPTLLEKLAAE